MQFTQLASYLVKLENDASGTPDVARLAPTHLKDYFRGAIVPGRDHTAMMLPVESGRTKINQFHPCVPHASNVPLGSGTVLSVPIIGHKQNILRLQVRVCKMVIMQELKTKEKREHIEKKNNK